MKFITQRKLAIIATVALLSVLPRPAMAVLGESDILNVFNPTLKLQFQVLTVTEEMEQGAPNSLWTLFTPGDSTQFGSPIALTEPGVAPGSPGYISDVVGVAFFNGQYILAFMSDDNLNPRTVQQYFGAFNETWRFVPEGGDEIDVTSYLDPSLRAIGASAGFQSDIEVPEPTTMIAGALLLLPFGASALRVLRKKRAA